MNKPSINTECKIIIKIIIGIAGGFFGLLAIGIPLAGQYLSHYGPKWMFHPAHAEKLGQGTTTFLALCFLVAFLLSAACLMFIICDET